jgi:2-keto-3-deoxy-L-rhamnonate aldolase RhmA
MSSLKEKLINRQVTIGSWITIGHPIIAEIMVEAGYDWLAIDMEHSSITMSEASNLIQVIDLAGSVPLMRVGSNDPYLIKRAMDAGAHGVIVPMINDRESAEKAISSMKYPPFGTRGVGLSRAQGYGKSFKEYKKWLETDSIMIIQIEHIDAVNNIEEIFTVKGIDGFIVGPYDLSSSLGFPGEFDHPKVIEALNKIKEFTLKNNILSGYHIIEPDWDLLNEKIKEGYKFIAFSLDIVFFGSACKIIKRL